MSSILLWKTYNKRYLKNLLTVWSQEPCLGLRINAQMIVALRRTVVLFLTVTIVSVTFAKSHQSKSKLCVIGCWYSCLGINRELRRFPLNVRAASAKIKLPKNYLQHCHILRTDKKNLWLLLLPRWPRERKLDLKNWINSVKKMLHVSSKQNGARF